MNNNAETIRKATIDALLQLDDPAVVERIGNLSERMFAMVQEYDDPRAAAYNIVGILSRFMLNWDGSKVVARRFRLFADMLEKMDVQAKD